MPSLDFCRIDCNYRDQGEGYHALANSTNHGWTTDAMGHLLTFGCTYSTSGDLLTIFNIGIHILATLG